jgi:hypothetical protein
MRTGGHARMPRMSASQRLGVAVVGAIVSVAIAFLALRAAGAPIGLGGPSPTPTATASPAPTETTTPTESAAASAPSDAETLAILAEIEQQVIAIRGLEAADVGPPEILGRDEVVEELRQLFEEEYPPEDRERDNIALRSLGLLDPDQDVAELQLDLLGDQVLGFYDDIKKRMVVVSDAGLDLEARITYAHEYTHALQDATWGLATLETDAPGEDDRGLARTALIEGDATLTMLAWMFQHLEQGEILEYLGSAEVPDTTGIPSWMVQQLAFPYEDGLNWASMLAGGDPFNPDYTAIDAAFEDPPDSTEQIIDITAWESREGPNPVEVADLATALGAGWEEVDATPIGQASIAIFLEYLGVEARNADDAAAGWGGDRAVIATGPDDAFAVAWRLAWDSAADAREFVDAYEVVVEGLGFPASVQLLPDGEVLVAHASSEALLARTVDAAD